jgi:uncharacterized protein (TIGR03083 family)
MLEKHNIQRRDEMLTAIEATRADRDALADIARGLTAAQWQAPSGCDGWTVQDVVTHLANLFWMVVDTSVLPDTSGEATEAAQGIAVAARRGLSAEEALADYEKVSETGLQRLAELAAADFELPLGDFGTYQSPVLASAYAFDHYTHIRADLFGPRGPLPGLPPPSDELRVGAALDWIEAALPQQYPAAAQACTLEIQVTGTGARVMTFGSGQPMATICSDAPALIRWITHRASWDELGVDAAGDEAALTVARTLKVY